MHLVVSRIFPVAVSTSWLLAALLLSLPAWLAAPLFFIWGGVVLWALGTWVRPQDGFERVAGGLVLLIPLFGVPLALFSVWSRLDPVTIALTTIFVACSAATMADGRWFWQRIRWPKLSRDWTLLAAGGAVAGDAALLLHHLLLRTDLPLRSPWEYASPAIFLVYAATTWLVLITAKERTDRLPLMISILHFGATYAVSLTVFQNGFGFDPFIHRAAESALATDGFIEPRRFLYSGQYALVAALHHLTRLPLFTIDQLLVPLLASTSLPLVAALGLTSGWQLERKQSQLWLHVLLLIPAMPFTFTVPHNLVFLFFTWTLFLFPRRPHALLPLACYAALIHPLLGVPLGLLVGAAVLIPRPAGWRRMALSMLFFLMTAVAVPLLLALGPRGAAAPQTSAQRLWDVDRFIDLFRDPYPLAGLGWEVVYLFRLTVPLAVLALGLIALKRHGESTHRLLMPFSFGLIVSLYALSTLFLFPDIIDYEQREFAFRLLQALLFCGLPPFAAWMSQMAEKYAHAYGRRAVLFGALACWAAAAWYVSYPQVNAKASSAGVSVGRHDKQAVRIIEERSRGTPHVVLANQMTSAAALQELGFRHYTSTTPPLLWYPLPTGGLLYGHYLRMNERPGRATAEDVARATGAQRVYFVTYDYWSRTTDIRRRAALDADHMFVVSAPDMVIFEYIFH